MRRVTEIQYDKVVSSVGHKFDTLKRSIFADLLEGTQGSNLQDNVGVDGLIYNHITRTKTFKEMGNVVNGDSPSTAYATCNYLVEAFRAVMKRYNVDTSSEQEMQKIADRMDQMMENDNAVESAELASNIEQKSLEEEDEHGENASDGNGIIGKIDLDRQLINLMKNNEFNEFSKLMGRLETVRGLAENARGLRGMRTQNLDSSDELGRVLTSEFAMLADDDCEDLFYDDYCNSQLLSWEEEGEEEIGNGNLIVMLDISASMCEPLKFKGLVTSRLMLAKTMCYSILRDRHNKKDRLLEFNWDIKNDHRFEGKRSTAKLLQILNIYTRGGTNFATPLRHAKTIVDQNPDLGYDILVITDASFSAEDEYEVRSFFNEVNCRLFSIVINIQQNDTMAEISRKSVHIDTGEDVGPQLDNLADLILQIEEDTNQEALG